MQKIETEYALIEHTYWKDEVETMGRENAPEVGTPRVMFKSRSKAICESEMHRQIFMYRARDRRAPNDPFTRYLAIYQIAYIEKKTLVSEFKHSEYEG